MFTCTVISLFLALQLTSPAIQPGWEEALKLRRYSLVQQNGSGTDSVLRDQLLSMRDQDQEARGIKHREPQQKTHDTQAVEVARIDRELTERLKKIIEVRGWPTIRLVGIDASNAAMLILTHSPDHVWQRTLLPQLEELADTSRIDPAALATVIDKELVASGKLQRYGSQFRFVDGAMAMYAVEDPANLDSRRAQVMLTPIDTYKALMFEMYHLPVSLRIISPILLKAASSKP